MRLLVLAIAVVALVACEAEPGYDAGYSDGYAATYNTACNIRGTMIHGNWNSAQYSNGYADGANEAAIEVANGACRE
jgi:hypothetical protein